MDASKYVAASGDGKISDPKTIRFAIANALRDMADQIEAGVRIVNEIHTNECASASNPVMSGLFIKSTLVPSTQEKVRS